MTTTGQARCGICSRLLDQPGDPASGDCGGDCMQCMADAGDPDCIKALRALQNGPWRVEPAGPPEERHFFAVRRLASGDLEFMLDEKGDPKTFPSDAAARASVAIANAKTAP